jgi:pimeloyl-ACP methyl ester carboxylesterase
VLWLLAATLIADSTQNIQIVLPRAETLHVEMRGTGEPAVLIPGLFGSAYAFRNLVPLLNARGYRTIIVEPLGIGASSKPAQADYSLGAQAERVAAALDTLGVRHALVLGHSVGGSEAFRLAYGRPDLVAALVSIEGGPAETAATASLKRAMRFAPWIKLLGGVRLIRWQIRKVLVASSGDPSWVSQEVVEGYTAAAARDLDGTLKAMLGVAASREHDRLAPHLAEIRCPVRLLIGGVPHDGDVGAAEVELLRQSLPRFALDSVPGAGHFLYEEQPQAVLDAVQRAALAIAKTPGVADP